MVRNQILGVVAIMAGILVELCLEMRTPKPAEKPEVLETLALDRIYYTKFGGVYCGNMEYTGCGVRLWNCVDDHVYICMHDIAYRDLHDEESASN